MVAGRPVSVQSPARKRLRQAVRGPGRRLTAAGGITTRGEIDLLDQEGVDAVVGMAIYTGQLALDP